MNERTAKTRREEYRDMTRAALISAGREVFAREGFAGAGTEAIARAARVTRGAFYHHFDGKLELFDAVVVSLNEKAASKVAKRARKYKTQWDRLIFGIDEYLEICLEPDYATLVIQSAPAVLGEARYLAIDEANSTGLLLANITALQQSGELQIEDSLLFGRMTNALICKLALLLQTTEDPKDLRADGFASIVRFLEAHRRPS